MTSSEPAANDPSPLSEDAFLSEPASALRRRRGIVFWVLLTGGIAGGLCIAACLVLSAMSDAKQLTAAADVLQTAQEIVPITLPVGYAGELAEVVKLPFFTVRKTIFRHESGKGVLSIVELKMPWSLAEQDAEVHRAAQIDAVVTDMRQIVATEESQRTITIQNHPAEFQLCAGRDSLSSTQLHEVRGVFHGQSGLAQLWLQAEDSVWNAESVERMLTSLAD